MSTSPRPEADPSKASAATPRERTGGPSSSAPPVGEAPLSVLAALRAERPVGRTSDAVTRFPAPPVGENRAAPERPRGFVARRIPRHLDTLAASAERLPPSAFSPASQAQAPAPEKETPEPPAPPAFPKAGCVAPWAAREASEEAPRSGKASMEPIEKALRIFESFAKTGETACAGSGPEEPAPATESARVEPPAKDRGDLPCPFPSESTSVGEVRKNTPWSLNMTRAFKVDPRLSTDETVEDKLQAMAQILGESESDEKLLPAAERPDPGPSPFAASAPVPGAAETNADSPGFFPVHAVWKSGASKKIAEDPMSTPNAFVTPFTVAAAEARPFPTDSRAPQGWEATSLPASVRTPPRIAPIAPPESGDVLPRPALSFGSIPDSTAGRTAAPPPIRQAVAGERAASARRASGEANRTAENDRSASDRAGVGWITILLSVVGIAMLGFYLNDIVRFIVQQEPLIERLSPMEGVPLESKGAATEAPAYAAAFTPGAGVSPTGLNGGQDSAASLVDLENPVEVVKAFHNAESVEMKQRYVTESGPGFDLVMAHFYRHAEEFTGPLTRVSVTSEARFSKTGRDFVMVRVEVKDRDGFFDIPLVRDAQNDLRFSWHAFVQFKERLFQKYSEGLWHEWSHFFVTLRRVTAEDYPENSVGRAWYVLSSPEAPGFSALAHVAHDGPIEADLRRRIEDGRTYLVQVELRQGIGGGLEIMKLRRTNWDPSPVGAPEEETTDAALSRLEDDRIPGLWE